MVHKGLQVLVTNHTPVPFISIYCICTSYSAGHSLFLKHNVYVDFAEWGGRVPRVVGGEWGLPFNYNCSLSEGHILSTVQATFGQAKYLHELYTYNTVPYTCLQLYVHVYSGYINSYCIIIPF